MELSYTIIFINGLINRSTLGSHQTKPTYMDPITPVGVIYILSFLGPNPMNLALWIFLRRSRGSSLPEFFLNGWMAAVSVGNRGEREWNAMMELLGS